MRRLALLLALVLSSAPAAALEPAQLTPSAATQEAELPAAATVMHSMGLDRLFVQFGRSIALSPRQHGIADERFLGAWEHEARKAFARSELAERLQSTLDHTLAGAELQRVGEFLHSPLGTRVTALEQSLQDLSPERQVAAIAQGQVVYLGASAERQAMLEELLQLTGAEITFAMLGESIRGMAVGMHLLAKGDLQVPWEDIDAEVKAQLAGMRQSLLEASRGALALSYAELTDAELEDYLRFLRNPATRKFYTVTAVTAGTIIRETMFTLGENVAARLQRVDI